MFGRNNMNLNVLSLMEEKFHPKLISLYNLAKEKAADELMKIEQIVETNCLKVLGAFQNYGVREIHFHGSTGYGYDDYGREVLDNIYAEIFGAEAGLVRWQIMSGTHAIALALFGNLRPGDELIAATGLPYDTLHEVIGLRGSNTGSLKDWGIDFKAVPLQNGKVDIEGLVKSITPKTKMVSIQRSRGYAWRPSLSVEEIGQIIKEVKKINKDIICFVDNCYGEFTQIIEPPQVGADLVAGSLIKNPGGGIAPTGGYLVGKKKYIHGAANRLSAPGLGRKIGATLDINRLLYQGLFFAPSVVGEAMKSAVLAAYLGDLLGFVVSPAPGESRCDIVQAIELGSPERLIAFCQGVQKGSPIDSVVSPEPSDMPGYDTQIIMAAGAFIFGSSIEISCDGPLIPPYIAYLQGGVHVNYNQVALLSAFQEMYEKGLLFFPQ